jgi:hypothetical protein
MEVIVTCSHLSRPFVEARASFHGFSLLAEIGFAQDGNKEYRSRHCLHMDAFRYIDPLRITVCVLLQMGET